MNLFLIVVGIWVVVWAIAHFKREARIAALRRTEGPYPSKAMLGRMVDHTADAGELSPLLAGIIVLSIAMGVISAIMQLF